MEEKHCVVLTKDGMKYCKDIDEAFAWANKLGQRLELYKPSGTFIDPQ